MATATAADTKKATYPLMPNSAWWTLRNQFKAKGLPKILDEEYLITVGIRQTADSATNLIRPMKRIGLFDEDGKPKDRAWNWIDDDKYSQVCQEILREVYPDTLTQVFNDPDADPSRVAGWFVRTLHTTPNFARQYAGFYLLLVRANLSEQEAATTAKPAKAAKATTAKKRGQPTRPTGAKAQPETPESDEASADDAQRSEPRRTPHAHVTRRVESALNINIQIHIPADAEAAQIDQIFASMAKHLGFGRDEDNE